MKKRIYQILFAFLILLTMFHFMAVPCQASWVMSNPDAVKPGTMTMPTEANEKAGKLLGVLQVVGSIIAVIILIVLGIRYMLGSSQEKADYKKSMMPYLVGAVLVFTGTLVPKVIYNIVTAIH